MTRRSDDPFPRIASFAALEAAARRAARSKRRKPGVAAFLADLEGEVLRLEHELLSGTWRPSRYVKIAIRDPKPRTVSAAPFRDRVVHHALCATIEPVFERGFIFDSYANRRGKGTHRAVARYERFRDRFAWVLRCDLYRYFPAIDHEILKADVRRRIRCVRTLHLVDAVINGSNPQEPVHRYYPGDDLFTPFERRRGLPIGNLTSQLFANIHLDGLDHFVKEVLRAPGYYLRYVDDFALPRGTGSAHGPSRAGHVERTAPRRERAVQGGARFGSTVAGGRRRLCRDSRIERIVVHKNCCRQSREWKGVAEFVVEFFSGVQTECHSDYAASGTAVQAVGVA